MHQSETRKVQEPFALPWPAVVGALLACVIAGVLRMGLIPVPALFHSVLLSAIAGIYIGFALLDGRSRTLTLESLAAVAFIAVGFLGFLYSTYLLALGFAAHGFWDMAHHRRGITTAVPGWYPRFCAVYDFVHAGFLVALGLAAASV